jgi:hypothetical protein
MGGIADEDGPSFDPRLERVHVTHLPNSNIFA